MASDATQFRRDFWTKYAELYPDDGVPSGWGRSHARVPTESAGLDISLAVLNLGVGVALRGHINESSDKVAERALFKDSFQKTVGDAFKGLSPVTEWINVAGDLDALREFDASVPENWQYMAEWLHYMLHIYLRVIEKAHSPLE